jgi:hypothetical protein
MRDRAEPVIAAMAAWDAQSAQGDDGCHVYPQAKRGILN